MASTECFNHRERLVALYESVIVARQEITKTQCDKIIKDFEDIVKSQKGSIKNVEYWGLRNLAYEINKNKKGHYTMMILEANPNSIAEYERNLKLHEDVIRFMTIRIKNYDDKPSVIFQSSKEINKE